MSEKEELRFMVSTFMTRAEYEARREREHPLESLVLLANYTKYTGERYTEEHIPAIIAGAAIELETAPEEVADDPDEWAAGYNCYGWPFLLKARILEAVTKSWVPGNHNTASMWAGYKENAEAFFEEFTELRNAFSEPPDETARRWSERTGAAPQTP